MIDHFTRNSELKVELTIVVLTLLSLSSREILEVQVCGEREFTNF